jgi:hypothetical protein
MQLSMPGKQVEKLNLVHMGGYQEMLFVALIMAKQLINAVAVG